MINNEENKQENNQENKQENEEKKEDDKQLQEKQDENKDMDKEKDKDKERPMSKSKRIVLKPIKPSPPKPLDKKEMYDYFKIIACDRSPQRKAVEKVIIILEEFSKIFPNYTPLVEAKYLYINIHRIFFL